MRRMEIPHRVLRAEAMDLDRTLCDLNSSEMDRQERILRVALAILVKYGRHTITFTGLAVAMKMATTTLRKHFTCMDALIAHLLLRHMNTVAFHLGQVPQDAPNRQQALRAAYLGATRTGFGAFTEAHLLFVHQRHSLPVDALEIIHATYVGIGEKLGGPSPLETLSHLDNPHLDAKRIEAILATYETAQPQTAPEPPAPEPSETKSLVTIQPQPTRPQPIRPRGKPLLERHPDDVWDYPGLARVPNSHAPPN